MCHSCIFLLGSMLFRVVQFILHDKKSRFYTSFHCFFPLHLGCWKRACSKALLLFFRFSFWSSFLVEKKLWLASQRFAPLTGFVPAKKALVLWSVQSCFCSLYKHIWNFSLTMRSKAAGAWTPSKNPHLNCVFPFCFCASVLSNLLSRASDLLSRSKRASAAHQRFFTLQDCCDHHFSSFLFAHFSQLIFFTFLWFFEFVL